MSFFSRLFGRNKAEPTAAQTPTAEPDTPEQDEQVADTSVPDAVSQGVDGPIDVADAADTSGYVDLGALLVPPTPNLKTQFEADKDSKEIRSVRFIGESSQLWVQVYASPRSEELWPQVRQDLIAEITREGGSVSEANGPFGRELLARLRGKTPDGRTSHRSVRFLGIDGPRWFVRAIISGDASATAAAATELEEVLRAIVVVRGDAPMPPMGLLPLTLPGGRRLVAEGDRDADPNLPNFGKLRLSKETTTE